MSFEQTLMVLYVFVCSATPVSLIWGWVRWARRPKQKTVPAMLALSGFALATASGLLAISALIYAQLIGGFPYYDPRLLRIYRWGIQLSLIGVIFGLAGVWRSSALRWHAPLSAAGALLFWILAASGE